MKSLLLLLMMSLAPGVFAVEGKMIGPHACTPIDGYASHDLTPEPVAMVNDSGAIMVVVCPGARNYYDTTYVAANAIYNYTTASVQVACEIREIDMDVGTVTVQTRSAVIGPVSAAVLNFGPFQVKDLTNIFTLVCQLPPGVGVGASARITQ